MIEKIKSLSWSTYSSLALILSNIFIVYLVSQIVLHTKEMANSKIVISYSILSLFVFILIKLNNAAIDRISNS